MRGVAACYGLILLTLCACERQAPVADAAPSSTASNKAPVDAEPVPAATPAPEATPPPAAQAGSAVGTRELLDSGPGWGFRAEWPAAVERYPRLAEAIRDSIGAARREIIGYATPEGDGPPCGPDAEPEGCEVTPPIETQMQWRIAIETPHYVAASMEGYRYTGGAHGMPMYETVHYEVASDRLLEVVDLMQNRSGWEALAERLRAELYRRGEESLFESPPEEVDAQRAAQREWIDRGTEPGPQQLGLFVPHAGADGRVAVLTFIFPPYQVGPYVEGTHGIDVPLTQIVDQLSPRWREALTGNPRSGP